MNAFNTSDSVRQNLNFEKKKSAKIPTKADRFLSRWPARGVGRINFYLFIYGLFCSTKSRIVRVSLGIRVCSPPTFSLNFLFFKNFEIYIERRGGGIPAAAIMNSSRILCLNHKISPNALLRRMWTHSAPQSSGCLLKDAFFDAFQRRDVDLCAFK